MEKVFRDTINDGWQLMHKYKTALKFTLFSVKGVRHLVLSIKSILGEGGGVLRTVVGICTRAIT